MRKGLVQNGRACEALPIGFLVISEQEKSSNK